MNFETATGTSIDAAFAAFHKANPLVYELFTEQVLRAIRRKRNKISAKTILGWIRWEVALDLKTNDVYKINDAFTSRYARQFVKQYPHYESVFNFRELRTGTGGKPGGIDANIENVLCWLRAGGKIVHHTDNDTVALLGASMDNKKQLIPVPIAECPLTKVLFNKMLAQKLLELDDTNMFTQTFTISKKGKNYK